MKRDKATIIEEILCAISKGKSIQSHIVNYANINATTFKVILPKLQEKGLIISLPQVPDAGHGNKLLSKEPISTGRRNFMLTDKGKEAVFHIKKFRKLLQ